MPHKVKKDDTTNAKISPWLLTFIGESIPKQSFLKVKVGNAPGEQFFPIYYIDFGILREKESYIRSQANLQTTQTAYGLVKIGLPAEPWIENVIIGNITRGQIIKGLRAVCTVRQTNSNDLFILKEYLFGFVNVTSYQIDFDNYRTEDIGTIHIRMSWENIKFCGNPILNNASQGQYVQYASTRTYSTLPP